MTTAGRLVYAGLVTRFLAYVLDALIVRGVHHRRRLAAPAELLRV